MCLKLLLQIHPNLKLITSQKLEDNNIQYQLSIEDNPFFTKYSITDYIHEELLNISKFSPMLKDFKLNDASWLKELHQLGLITLEYNKKKITSEIKSNFPNRNIQLFEHETKTTPTCLTSYLK